VSNNLAATSRSHHNGCYATVRRLRAAMIRKYFKVA